MDVSRRSWFGTVAGGLVAGPSMAKEVAAQSMCGAPTIPWPKEKYYGGGNDCTGPASDPYWEAEREANKALQRMRRERKLPEWKMREYRNDLRYSDRIEPDLDSLRSMSLSAKRRIQLDRNIEQRLQYEDSNEDSRSLWESFVSSFKKVF